MKQFLVILGAGFVVFVAVAVVQEWEVFSQPWFAAGPEAEAAAPGGEALEGARDPGPEAETVARVESALRRYHAVVRHAYASGGDDRFLQRIPAAEGLVREIREDVDYLRRNRRVQETTLVSLDVLDVETRDEGQVSARVKLYQVTRTRRSGDGGEADPARSQVGWFEYHLAPERDGLRVEAWAPVEAPVGAGDR